MHILNTIFYIVIAVSLMTYNFYPEIGLLICILTCILGASLSIFGLLNEVFMKPRQRLREEDKRIEDEKNNLMSELEKEAKRKRSMDYYQQN